MSFIGGLNFPRVVIALSLLGSAVLAYFDYSLGVELERLKEETATKAPQMATKVQEHALQLTQLSKQIEDEGWKGQGNPGSYVRAIAQDDNVRLGQVDVSPSNPDRFPGGIVDKKYTIKPVNKERGWSRQNIANFLFKLESDSRRVRVTRLKMQLPSKRRVQPHEFPPDEWTYEVEITSRQREQ
jgi:hypothetical protein